MPVPVRIRTPFASARPALRLPLPLEPPMRIDPQEILERIAEGEGRQLEFKRGLPRDAKTARTLCAFANTRGGLLLVGVGDRGELLGAPRPRETVQRLRAIAAEHVDPPVALEAGSVVVGGVPLVWASVPLSARRPHACRDEQGGLSVVVRAGSSNRRATGATLRALAVPRSGSLDPLQRRVLEWVARQHARDPHGVTAAAFARENNVGRQRARRAFTQLELAGRLVAHGTGVRRVFAPA
jgi:hypothetical protein